MGRSDNKSLWLFILIIYTVAALMVPNVWLDISEINISVIGKVLNIILPLSFYFVLVLMFRKQGWGLLCLFPFMLFAAFQIVLLFLYGESLIAVDMFLNVVTTDFAEATTLLGNLYPSIILVCVLYLPGLIGGVVALSKHKVLAHYPRLLLLWWSGVIFVLSGVLLLILALSRTVVPGDDIFPVNVINNCCLAVKRDRLARQYPESASEFTYHAEPGDSTRRIITIVIGETARPDQWQLFDAERGTNPRLSQREGIYAFKRAITQSNTTHKSVPLLLTPLTAETFGELNGYKSLITAFKEAGYQTTWISNQPPNGAYNEHMGFEADTTLFFKYAPDVQLAAELEKVLAQRDTTRSQLIVMHTYGAHFPYHERYEDIMNPVFTPDKPMTAKKSNREALINAYDNATIATDIALDSIIGVIDRFNNNAFLIYAADHGEDIFDDYRSKFLHASPAPTYYQLRVPMFVWIDNNYSSNDTLGQALTAKQFMPLSPSETLFHTALDAANIKTPYFVPEKSLFSENFSPGPLMYLTDRNIAVPLAKSGVREVDRQDFERIGVDIDK